MALMMPTDGFATGIFIGLAILAVVYVACRVLRWAF